MGRFRKTQGKIRKGGGDGVSVPKTYNQTREEIESKESEFDFENHYHLLLNEVEILFKQDLRKAQVKGKPIPTMNSIMPENRQKYFEEQLADSIAEVEELTPKEFKQLKSLEEDLRGGRKRKSRAKRRKSRTKHRRTRTKRRKSRAKRRRTRR